MNDIRRPGFMTVALTLLACAACRLTDVPIWKPMEVAGSAAAEVECVWGVRYGNGPEADDCRQQLDLFLPKGQSAFPVVVLVHAGAWITGDNRCCGLYSSVGEYLASRGIGTVLPNYHLSPDVQHPEHARDVARAVAWTARHIGAYGGRADQLFLVGHSAGGHLVSLLATDDQYLKAEGRGPEDIKGVVGISGVYHIPPGDVAVTLGGPPPAAFHFDEVMPLRQASWSHGLGSGLPGIPLNVNVYGRVFGDDAEARALASPVNHVHPGLPPFLLVNAEHELPTLLEMTEEFQQALDKAGCAVQVLRVPARNHNSVMFRAVEDDDPVAKAIVEFVRQETGQAR